MLQVFDMHLRKRYNTTNTNLFVLKLHCFKKNLQKVQIAILVKKKNVYLVLKSNNHTDTCTLKLIKIY